MRTIKALSLGLSLLALVSACGFYGATDTDSGAGDPASVSMPPSGSGGAGGSAPPPFSVAPRPPIGSQDAIIAIPSVPGTLSVAVGGTRTLTVTFVSSDGLPIRGLEVWVTTPPEGWSGLEDDGCRSVGAGGSCVATLTYAPTSIGSGNLTLNYVFISNADMQMPGAIEIPYMATPNNNVVASASLTGQVDAAVGGGKQTVAVEFTTDNGNAATQLTVTNDLANLPTSWSSGASGLSCPIVSTGSGCQLLLAFGPASPTSGVLALDYSYVDDSGAPRTGTLNIPYAATSNGNIVATVSPSGEIIAVQGGGVQPVSINFTTADGRPASDLVVLSNLGALPEGWTSKTARFTCSNVSTGNGCQLALTYAPAVVARGTLSLDYYYADAAGTFRIGTVDVPYAATTEDNVVGSATPSGQISAIVGQTSSSLVVTFTTDDGRPATALEVTGGLSVLPAGWSSPQDAVFTCPGVSSGSGCQLMLSYTPVVADAGTIALSYSYLNDAGEARTGTVDISFRATTDNQINATPSHSPLAVMSGSVTPVTIRFTTDDGNPATGFAITSGLAPLPPGWSSSSGTFTCATVDASGACELDLTYAPSVPASGTLTLGYSYINNSGIAKTGTVSVDYMAGP
ncbi:MAG: hypothetical protein ACREUT_06050 [Steroidobacteraceae bacterium]